MIDTGYYTSEALTLLHSLIGIPSISREEEAAADFLQNYIEETGIMTGRSGNNIWCISPCSTSINLHPAQLTHRYREAGQRMEEATVYSQK